MHGLCRCQHVMVSCCKLILWHVEDAAQKSLKTLAKPVKNYYVNVGCIFLLN